VAVLYVIGRRMFLGILAGGLLLPIHAAALSPRGLFAIPVENLGVNGLPLTDVRLSCPVQFKMKHFCPKFG
jgi:hypothetical protein